MLLYSYTVVDESDGLERGYSLGDDGILNGVTVSKHCVQTR